MSEKAEVLKRLANLDQKRKEERERKREEQKAKLNPNESSEKFLADFHTRLVSCQDKIDKLTAENGAEVVREECETLVKELNAIDNDVSQAVYYLPSYDLRQCRRVITDTKKTIEDIKTSLAPKKKFAFSRRTKTSEKPTLDTNEKKVEPMDSVSSTAFSLQSVEDKDGEILKISGEQLGGRGFLVANCRNCIIDLDGSILALQLRNLTHCTVLSGPITGATMAFNLEDCNVVLASGQVRIHNSLNCRFHLRVRSSPIIEDSTELKFGPLASERSETKIDETRFALFTEQANVFCAENGSWKSISDFNWIKEEPSPNWSIISEDE
eukprot:g4459.t1